MTENVIACALWLKKQGGEIWILEFENKTILELADVLFGMFVCCEISAIGTFASLPCGGADPPAGWRKCARRAGDRRKPDGRRRMKRIEARGRSAERPMRNAVPAGLYVVSPLRKKL